MDNSIVVFTLLPLSCAWFHLSSYSFYFNVFVSFILALLVLYLVVANTFLLPIEHLLFFLFYRDKVKGETHEKKVAFDDEITRKIRELIGHIVRDFILDWYNAVSDDVNFVQESFELFEHVFTSIRIRVSEIDAQIFVGHLLRFLSRHLACYQHALQLAEKQSPNDQERKRQLVVITYETQLGHLAMSNYPDSETDHLRSLTAVLLKALLPRDYRLTGASLYVVRELIAKNVLLPLIDKLTDPYWINKNIVLILSDSLEEVIDDSEEWESTSSESEETEIDSQPLLVPIEEPVPPSPSKKPVKNLAVTFSVAANEDELDLDVEYHERYEFNEGPMKKVLSRPQLSTTNEPSDVTVPDGHSETDNNPLNSEIDPSSSLTVAGSRLEYQDDRFFQRIRIPSAMTIEEPFEGGSKYTLYTIEYCAPSFSHDQHDDITADIHLEYYQVKRRFREFLTLQERLNEKPVMRRLVRHVRAPSRMFPMPIGNMEKEYIEKRRKFLQAYLRELCSFSHVNHSSEMREFLSYNADPRIAFVRRSSNYIPRFDKIFKSVVQDLFGAATDKFSDKFSSTTHVETDDSMIFETPLSISDRTDDPPSSPSSVTSLYDITQSTPKMRNPVTKLKNIVLGRGSETGIYEEAQRDYALFSGPQNPNEVRFGRGWRSPGNLLENRTSFHVAGRRTQGDGCEAYNFEYEDNKQRDVLTGCIFRLVHQTWGVHVGTNTMLYSLLGRFVKKYVDLCLNFLTSEQQWILYLKTLQTSMWPGGKWGGKEDETRNKAKALEEAQEILEDTFPDVLRHLVGQGRYSDGVAELLASVQEPLINRHIAYHLLDILIKSLFPDLPTVITRTPNVSL